MAHLLGSGGHPDASWQKIFSADPSVGYWTQHAHDVAAQHAGETAFGSATNADEINDAVRNTFGPGHPVDRPWWSSCWLLLSPES